MSTTQPEVGPLEFGKRRDDRVPVLRAEAKRAGIAGTSRRLVEAAIPMAIGLMIDPTEVVCAHVEHTAHSNKVAWLWRLKSQPYQILPVRSGARA